MRRHEKMSESESWNKWSHLISTAEDFRVSTCCPDFWSKLTIFGLCKMARHSKLQKQVLALYRQFLRAGQEKPGFVPRIRDEFRENARIKKTDVMHIEYLYRRGQRQLEQLRDVNTKQLGSFSKPTEKSWGHVTLSNDSQHLSETALLPEASHRDIAFKFSSFLGCLNSCECNVDKNNDQNKVKGKRIRLL